MNPVLFALGLVCLATVNVQAQVHDASRGIIDAFDRGRAMRMAQEAHQSDLETAKAVREYYRQQLRLLETQN